MIWAGSADAARHALIIGVGKYEKDSGIDAVPTAANDVEDIGKALAPLNFAVTVMREDDVKDRSRFDAAFDDFVRRIQPNDDVVVYLTGQGYNSREIGNLYLLSNAMSLPAYLKGPGAATAKSSDGREAVEKEFQNWLTTRAISEAEIVKALQGRAAQTIVVMADASRNLMRSSPPSGIRMPPPEQAQRGVFRLYSTGPGQVSLDAPRIARSSSSSSSGNSSEQGSSRRERDRDRDRDGGNASSRVQTLFSKVLQRELRIVGLDINVLAAKLQVTVRDESRKGSGNVEQIPDYSDDRQSSSFVFYQANLDDNAARCQLVDDELLRLRSLVARGSIGRGALEQKWFELAPCGKGDEVASLMRLEAQGAGALAGGGSEQLVDSNLDDPIRKCDVLASSPLDANKLQGVGAGDIQQVALRAISGEVPRASAATIIREAIAACTVAVQDRGRVARYKFNLGRAYYAMSLLDDPKARGRSLERASAHFGEAVELGYAAAFNALGQLYLNGEVYVVRSGGGEPQRHPSDRDRARRQFERGAALNDVLANYNLGMSYKYGDNGQTIDRAKAFQHLSLAAESGFIPAMIETALEISSGKGVKQDNKRAVELLEIAATRGSSEAMYWLGVAFGKINIDPELRYDRDISRADWSQSVVWYARAAELGDSRAQAELAQMLASGDGLPSPQPEAAGRYWRLAAEGGSSWAQFSLANLIRDTKIPPRPKVGGAPDSGAHEMRALYEAAFARDIPRAGLELAKLFRTGFPRERGGSAAIPKDSEKAITLLRDVIDRIRAAPGDSEAANPLYEVQSAHQLIEMVNAGENKRRDSTTILSDDQISQLKADYGDPSEWKFIRVRAVTSDGNGINCPFAPSSQQDPWVFIWNWQKPEPPTDMMFDWFERVYKCKEIAVDDKKTKPEDRGVLKRVREAFKREHEAWRKDKTGAKTFVKRMEDLVNKEPSEKQERRRR